MSDELSVPQVPEPKPDDHEDVSWALSTAEAMWARGDHLEGIKWVRKAAEAASDAEADSRSLELAKAAADLAALITRRSQAEIPGRQRAPVRPPEPALAPAPAPASIQPTTTRSGAPPPPSMRPPPAAGAIGKGKSIPPAAGAKSIPPPAAAATKSIPPAAPSSAAARPGPRPLATSARPQGPAEGKGIITNRPAADPKKTRRRSRENLDAEAAAMRAPLESGPDLEATTVGSAKELLESSKRLAALVTGTADEGDGESAGDRKTALGTPSARPPAAGQHDPGIVTSQAVRVVVWRDANGVHVAPAGTVVSAIKIDALLVTLEPNADLTAWLTQRAR